ncbi:MAG TPA: class II aldolase/adducin family protein [Candidatus Udaeobacter sp.]|jgi:L-fuculose-phosphate aldolase|nr:class II aldolase/adducin family protein [Candidatus Udaeobacter sp.]
MNDLTQLREMVARSCRILGKLNLTKEPSGHVSARVSGEDKVLIKARGPDESGLRFVTAQDIITVNFDGKKLDGAEGLESPQEVFIHTWLYKTRPDVNCVVHVHPVTVVLFTICNKPLQPLFGAYDPSALRLIVSGLSTYPRSVTVSNNKLGEEFVQAMGGKPACLMRGHGITSAGATVEEATLTAIKLNDVAEINYRASLLGNPQPIPPEDIEAIMGSTRGETKSVHAASAWRYYCALLGE